MRGDRVARVDEVDGRVAAGDPRLVERVEDVGAQLNGPAAAQVDGALQRQVERALEAALQVVVPGLEPDRARQRALERRRR